MYSGPLLDDQFALLDEQDLQGVARPLYKYTALIVLGGRLSYVVRISGPLLR